MIRAGFGMRTSGGESSLALYRGPKQPLLLVRQRDVTAEMLREARRLAKGQGPRPRKTPSPALQRAMATLGALYPGRKPRP